MSSVIPEPFAWRRQLADSFTDLPALCRYLRLNIETLPVSIAADRMFPVRVTPHFADNMVPGDPNDPLLLQVLAQRAETFDTPGFSDDPVGDKAAQPVGGVLHKYRGRALLLATGACAIHCRYCFRRNFSYTEHQLTGRNLATALAYLGQQPEIEEIILSGGDPLMLGDERLADLILQLANIPQLKRVRIHSRLPVVLPDRITEGLLTALTDSRLNCVMVIHANHARELCPKVAQACQRMQQRGIRLLNQTVLLRAINDQSEALIALSQRLFDIGVWPYYLHLLDRVRGAGHFEVSEASALALHQAMAGCLPGYLTPKLVREQAGAPAKQLIVAES